MKDESPYISGTYYIPSLFLGEGAILDLESRNIAAAGQKLSQCPEKRHSASLHFAVAINVVIYPNMVNT